MNVMYIEKQLDYIFTCKPANKDELQHIIAERIIKYGNECDLNDIDVSLITDMNHLFECNYRFSGDISKWDVSNVTNMNDMFNGCENFNCDLSKWNISNTNNYMFEGCDKFKYNIW